jgi:hypothetical protein
MAVISRYRWRISITTAFILAALILSLVATIATRATSHASGGQLTQISSDPYTNPDSNHKTQVEPDTFAFGHTVVSVFQSGRFFDGGASNIGFATSANGGETWTHGFLPGTTIFATPPGPSKYHRVSDPSVAYDAKHKVWITSYLAFFRGTSVRTDVLVSRSTDGGLTWGLPVPVNTSGVSNVNCTVQTCQLDVGFISSTNGGTSWSAAEHLAGPMKLTWLPLTTAGFMVGDYISTSIVPGDDDATPVFEVAQHPTGTPTCSNLTTGAPGQHCHEATFTTPEDLLQIVGGANPATSGPTNGLANPSAHIKHTAN